MEFEWSDRDSALNFARYAVRFSEAVHVFLDPKAVEFANQSGHPLSLIGRTARGLLYVVFDETTDGRVRILHARVADAAGPPVEPQFDFNPRQMKRVPRPDRHVATAADVSPRHCKVTLPLELDADLAAAFRDRPDRVIRALREALQREEQLRLVGDETLLREVSRRSRPHLGL